MVAEIRIKADAAGIELVTPLAIYGNSWQEMIDKGKQIEGDLKAYYKEKFVRLQPQWFASTTVPLADVQAKAKQATQGTA